MLVAIPTWAQQPEPLTARALLLAGQCVQGFLQNVGTQAPLVLFADQDALLETMGSANPKYIQKRCAHVRHHGLLHTMLQAAERAAQSVTSARWALAPLC